MSMTIVKVSSACAVLLNTLSLAERESSAMLQHLEMWKLTEASMLCRNFFLQVHPVQCPAIKLITDLETGFYTEIQAR